MDVYSFGVHLFKLISGKNFEQEVNKYVEAKEPEYIPLFIQA